MYNKGVLSEQKVIRDVVLSSVADFELTLPLKNVRSIMHTGGRENSYAFERLGGFAANFAANPALSASYPIITSVRMDSDCEGIFGCLRRQSSTSVSHVSDTLI